MLKIEGKNRELNNSVDKNNQVIGVIYGGDIEKNILVILDYNEFNKIFAEAGTSQIISLNIEGEEYDVLVKEFQLDPVNDRFVHIDFYAITKGQEVEVSIPFEFIGESPAVKLGNVLNKVHTDIKVTCLPKDIPAYIEIDLSVLETTQDSIRLEDIKLGDGVKFISENMSDVVVSVSVPVEEVEEEVVKEESEDDKEEEVVKEEDEEK